MIIGREKEVRLLTSLLSSEKCEFVAVYGRRRVGKTFLIDETYKGHFAFSHTGSEPLGDSALAVNKKQRQLNAFERSLLRYGAKKQRGRLKSWNEAFSRLEQLLNHTDPNRHHVIFIDEMPWMDTPKSGFLSAFSDFYNGYLCHLDNMILVVCGSASSWISDKLIHGNKGLYRRITRKIRLRPFTLGECGKFLEYKNCHYSPYEVALSYMSLGGIPYYLDYFQAGFSAKQNIDFLLFGPDRELEDEFEDLFTSQFSDPDTMKSIIELLSNRNLGYTANEIASILKLDANGAFFQKLKALERSDFLLRYVPFGKSKKEVHYKLIDPFCFFYLKRVKGNEEKKHHFVTSPNSPIGFSFENLCFNHLDRIESKLSIGGIETEATFYTVAGDEDKPGAQIDLIIKRKDGGLNLCEMKFYSKEYSCSEKSHLDLERKIASLSPYIKKKGGIYPVLITSFGFNQGAYSSDYPFVITLSDLMA